MYKNHNPRKPSDDYQTPFQLARAICKALGNEIPNPKLVWEPSAGLGHFVAASKDLWPTAVVHAVEVRQECEANLLTLTEHVHIKPWEDLDLDALPPPDLIIGNPPYEFALEHLMLSLKRVMPAGHVAFLLRMAFLNSQERVRALWEKNVGFRYLLPLAQRPSFTGDRRTEHSEYAVYVFQAGYSGNAEILPHLWVGKDGS